MTQRNRVLRITVAIAVTALLVAPSVAAMETLRGEIAEVNPEQSTLTVSIASSDASGDSMTLQVREDTRIFRDGATIELSELTAGEQVTVNYEKDNGTYVALAIAVGGEQGAG